MKTITTYLVQFALLSALLTLVFRYFLSYGIENQSTVLIAITTASYALLMFASGWHFGRKEGDYLPINDVGFRFHLTTYLIHNGFSLLWIRLGLGSKYENINVTTMVAIYWGIFLLLHFGLYLWAKKNSINDLDKEDLFD